MRLELHHIGSPASHPELHVLRTTADFVFVDKPASAHTVRLRPDDPPTLADAVVAGFPECAAASEDPREGGAIHRLDRETTGVVCFARSRAAWHRGRAAITTGARKLYLAIGEGAPTPWPPAIAGVTRVDDAEEFPDPALGKSLPFSPTALPAVRVAAALHQHGPRGATMRVDPRGEPSVSLVRPLHTTARAAGPLTWVCVRLLTGRRHQARVHLAWLRLPVVGDARYGAAPRGDGRLLLHAWALDLGLAAAGSGPVLAPLPAPFLRLA
jgi:23S rRNA pseudouridine1911/1915/1917 synthase